MLRKKKGTKKIKPWKIIVIAVVLIVGIRFAAGVFMGSKELIPSVDTAEAVKGTITSTLETSGTIASELTRVYASPVNAQIGEVPVKAGLVVKKGEYLISYDTSSLQKSYDIAELQAKAEEATSNATLAKSSESAADFAASDSDVKSLQGQVDAVNAEIAGLQAQLTENEIASNNNAAINSEISSLSAEAEGIASKISLLEQKKGTNKISDGEREQLKQLKAEKEEKDNQIGAKKSLLRNPAEIANNMTNLQAQLTQKNAQLSNLQGRLSEAQSKKSAAEAGILSASAKENISYSKQASKLTLERSASDLSKAKAGIAADFDGIVTQVSASAGTIATEGMPLVTLASASDICVDIFVSKYNLMNLKIGQSATVEFQEKEYKGIVDNISKVAEKKESGSAMVTVKIHIENPDDALILGLDAKVTVDLGSAENVLIVPVTAVNTDKTGDFVYAVEQNAVVKKYVTTGMSSKEEIEIKDGLEQGEKVITTVDSSITEGMAVTETMQGDTEAVLMTEAAE